MARIRTIKPEFWSSGQILECSRNARLLFIGMWNFCDDLGRHKFSGPQLKAEIFPGDEIDYATILEWFRELEGNGLVTVYEVDNVEYFEVTGWHNQRIDKPRPAKFPPNPNKSQNRSTNGPGTFRPDRIVEEGKGREKKEDNTATTESVSRATDGGGERVDPEQAVKDLANRANSAQPWTQVIAAYDDALAEVFGAEHRRPYPASDDADTAKAMWEATGGDLAKIKSVFLHGMARLREQEDRPSTMKYFSSAVVRAARPAQPGNGGTPPPAYDADAKRALRRAIRIGQLRDAIAAYESYPDGSMSRDEVADLLAKRTELDKLTGAGNGEETC